MLRVIQFIIFIGIFLAIYYGMHFYVFVRLGQLLGLRQGAVFHLVIAGFALSYPMASLLVKFFYNFASRAFYGLASVWLGILFFLLSALVLYEVVRFVVRVEPRIAAFIIIGAVLLLSVYATINGLLVQVKTVEVQLPNLEKEVRIVQLSDLHIGTINNAGYLSKVVEKTNQFSPDIVAITGDLVDGSGPLRKESYSPIREIKSQVYFTTGNHERYEGVDAVVKLLDDMGVRTLRNELVRVQGIQLIGIDDPGDNFRIKNSELSKISIAKEKPAVLMFHTPHGIEESIEAGIDLQLSGHTHNGQVIPFNFVVKAFHKYTKGLYKIDNLYLYVTPGTGTWGPPMRLGSRNEITLIRLLPGG